MGLDGEGVRKQFLHVSCGFLKGKNKETKEPISGRSFTGHLLNIERFDDEFEGQPVSKIRLTMKDELEDFETQISFTEQSWYAVGFFARVQNLDITLPVTIGASPSDKNEKISFCWMKQGANKIEKMPTAVSPEKVAAIAGRAGSKDTYNWLSVFPVFDAITAQVVEKIHASYGGIKDPEQNKKDKQNNPPVHHNTGNDVANGADDDLPF